MASTHAKRLAKLEELMASRLNQPLATLWLDEGVSREEACIRAGYDVSLVDRIRFVRWMTKEEAGIDPPSYSWDQAKEPGPPKDDLHRSVEPEARPAQVVTPDPEMQPLSEPVPVDPVEEDIDRACCSSPVERETLRGDEGIQQDNRLIRGRLPAA
jgi:hypothetical protein